MLNVKRKTARGYRSTLPERYGGSLLFRVPYLESKWVRFVFKTLVMSVAVMLMMAAVAGKVEQWQQDYRQQNLSRIETELALCSGQQTAAELAGDLVGQADALERAISLLQQKEELLSAVGTPVQSEESAGPHLPELAQKSADLKRLQGAITDTYAAAESAYGQGETLEALRMFETVNGYADAERWKELCSVRIHREITRYFAQDKLLTAWVQQMLFLQQTRPQKAETIPLSFGALRGIWICRDDQQIHVQQLATESGDGRAGTAPEGVPPIRCLMAEGDALYGCRADEMLAPASEENFTETICTGGILRAEKAAENQDPAAAVLVVKAQDGRSEDGIGRLEVISENIIVIKEGEWKGTYYRVLEN